MSDTRLFLTLDFWTKRC